MNWQFDHLAFDSGDSNTLQQGLSTLLGLKQGRRPPFPFPGRWLYQGEQPLVHIIDYPEGGTRLSHLALRTDADLDSVLAQVKTSALPYRLAQVPEDGTWQVFVQLPGLVLELDIGKRKIASTVNAILPANTAE